MSRRVRWSLALAIGTAVALVFLVAKETARNYPAEDGLVLQSGELLGGDFLAFYIGGRLFGEDRTRLYDIERQRALKQEILGAHADARPGELPFVYPPLVAAVLAPFSRLPFQSAFIAWTLLGVLVSVGALILVIRRSGASEVLPTPVLLLFCLAFLPYSMNALAGGQIAWLGIALLALVAVSVLERKDFLAGLALSLSYYKPPLFTLLLLTLCLARPRRFLAGFLVGATVLMGTTLGTVGTGGTVAYVDAVSSYTYGQEFVEGVELPPAEGMGLVALVFAAVDSMSVTVGILAVPFVLIMFLGRRLLLSAARREETLLGLTLMGTASVGFSLQCIKYDLSLLLIPMILGIAWLGPTMERARALVLAPFLLFYFEFAFRQLSLGGASINASSFLFLAVVSTLGAYAWVAIDRGRADPPAPLEPAASRSHLGT